MSESITPVSTAYKATKWEKGDIISAYRLNQLENAAATASAYLEGLGPSSSAGPITGVQPNGTLKEITVDSNKAGYLFTAGALAESSNVANGWVRLNSNCIIPPSLLPSYVDDILEYDAKDATSFTLWPDWVANTEYNIGARVKVANQGYICKTATSEENFNINNWKTATVFPTGNTDTIIDDAHTPSGPEHEKIYVALDTGRTYRWGGSDYVEIGVTHLDYDDTQYPETVPATTDWNKYYVKRVTQADGQISVIHEPFAPSISWVGATSETGNNNSDKPRITLSVGGNSAITGDPNIATTALYGVTKLNDTLNSSSTELAATANTVKVLKDTINALDYNDDNTDENNGTASQGTSFGANDTKFVSSVTQDNGQIKVTHRDFSPSISIGNGQATAPTINVTVAGNTMSNPPTIPLASSTNFGVVQAGNDISIVNGVISGNYSIADSYNSSTNKLATETTVNTGVNTAKTYTDTQISSLGTAAQATVETSPIANNSSSNKLPTSAQVATFVEGKNYLTSFTETDPTVPQWAKEAQKPTYTASEVGAMPANPTSITIGSTTINETQLQALLALINE